MRLRGLLAVAGILFWLAIRLTAGPQEVTIVSYNVRNYTLSGSSDDESGRATPPKPRKSIEALIRILTEIRPDILGVCEMGERAAFDDFRSRLKQAGLDYPETEYLQGPDDERHLALLSRFPIVERNSRAEVPFQLAGREQRVRRGFLDITVRVRPDYALRLVGAHLKSKLPVPEGEALLRRHEAQLLRKHVEGILKESPRVNLMVYGDFNDTKNEPAIQEIMGVKGAPDYLADLWARDEVGDRWTYYWKTADVYSRIDFVFVNQALFPEVLLKRSRIYRSPFWEEASDHRPVVATIEPKDR